MSARQGISRTLIVEYWIPVLFWVVLTHIFSTDAFSSGETSQIIVPLLTFLFPGVSFDGINLLHAAVRKAGHVTGYFILGVLANRLFDQEKGSAASAKAFAILFVIAAAISDEAHQSLTLSRTGSVIDVAYDCAGGVLAALLLPAWKDSDVARRARLTQS